MRAISRSRSSCAHQPVVYWFRVAAPSAAVAAVWMRGLRDSREKLSTRSTIVDFGRLTSMSRIPHTRNPKTRLITSGEPPESRNVDTGERWYGANSEGVGAT